MRSRFVTTEEDIELCIFTTELDLSDIDKIRTNAGTSRVLSRSGIRRARLGLVALAKRCFAEALPGLLRDLGPDGPPEFPEKLSQRPTCRRFTARRCVVP